MRAIRILSVTTATALLAACAPPLPDSGVQGTGFGTAAQQREAQLSGQAPLQPVPTVLPPATPLGTGTSGVQATPMQTEAQVLASQALTALGRGAPPASAAPEGAPVPEPLPDAATSTTTLPATPPATTPPATTPTVDPQALNLDRDNPNLSREQDFAAVSAQRDIDADAERLRIAREQYQQIQPREMERPETSGPNVFAYALNEAKPIGSQTYRRGLGASARRAAERCQAFRSDDIAQEEFLASGGPQRDKLGVDPDGDGNACGWDPAVVRNLVNSQ